MSLNALVVAEPIPNDTHADPGAGRQGIVVEKGHPVRSGERWRRAESSQMFPNQDRGTILVTGDGGQIWNAQESRADRDLNSVHFHDDTKGWAVGNHGTIVSTSDGGQNWREQESGGTESLRSVRFSNSKVGWAVGSEVLPQFAVGELEITNTRSMSYKVFSQR